MARASKDMTEKRERLRDLRKVLKGARTLLIVLQDFPDPDAIGAAGALRLLARDCGELTTSIACAGIVGRAENRALVRYLGMNLLTLTTVDISSFDCVAMVDTQPGTGNNSLPESEAPCIVIDHHPLRSATRRATFYDVRRRYGATSSILWEYLQAAGLEPGTPLATALLYGIRSDTNDLGREAIQADIDAFLALYPLANKRKLGRIVMERLPRDYFCIMSRALVNAKTFGRCVISDLRDIGNPDMIGEVADLLLRNEESDWALCYGCYDETMMLSLRTVDLNANAGEVMHRLVSRLGTGGGHSAMAGGQISLAGRTAKWQRELATKLEARFLRLMKEDEACGEKLVERRAKPMLPPEATP